jgi:hypothetical protein
VDESETATGVLRHGVELPDKLFGLHEVRPRGSPRPKLVHSSVAEEMRDEGYQ